MNPEGIFHATVSHEENELPAEEPRETAKQRAERFFRELGKEGLKQYIGNENQVKLARALGISGLHHLYQVIKSFGLVEELKYNHLYVDVLQFEKLIEILKQEGFIEKYKGEENKVRLAKEAGINNLFTLYSMLKSLGFVERLEYKKEKWEDIKTLETAPAGEETESTKNILTTQIVPEKDSIITTKGTKTSVTEKPLVPFRTRPSFIMEDILPPIEERPPQNYKGGGKKNKWK